MKIAWFGKKFSSVGSPDPHRFMLNSPFDHNSIRLGIKCKLGDFTLPDLASFDL